MRFGFWGKSDPAEGTDAPSGGAPEASSSTSPTSPTSPSSSSSTLDPSPAPSFSTPEPEVWVPEEPAPEPERERLRELYDATPSNLLLLPAVGGVVGFFLGMRRGATAARLQFLAENAHRQPTTVQGWYFYLKTRNYRMLAAGMKSGAKYAAGLGGATALFVATDEAGGWAREQLEAAGRTPFAAAPTEANPDRWGWRKRAVHIEDGVLAGSVLTLIVGLGYRLPTPVFLRGGLMGVGAGALYSGLQIAQDHIAQLRREERAVKDAAAEAELQAERERRIAQGLPAEEKSSDELKSPEERNFFERIGAWARGRDKKEEEEESTSE